jgi:hypothetical protein
VLSACRPARRPSCSRNAMAANRLLDENGHRQERSIAKPSFWAARLSTSEATGTRMHRVASGLFRLSSTRRGVEGDVAPDPQPDDGLTQINTSKDRRSYFSMRRRPVRQTSTSPQDAPMVPNGGPHSERRRLGCADSALLPPRRAVFLLRGEMVGAVPHRRCGRADAAAARYPNPHQSLES